MNEIDLDNNNLEILEKIDVAHICLFEETTKRILLQFNNKFQKFSFIWWKCDKKNDLETILDEMWYEVWYTFLKDEIFEVLKNEKLIWWKMCYWTIFTWVLPKWFESIDLLWEWKSSFYNLWDAPFDDFITWDTKEEIERVVKQCYKVLYLNWKI